MSSQHYKIVVVGPDGHSASIPVAPELVMTASVRHAAVDAAWGHIQGRAYEKSWREAEREARGQA